MNLLQGQLSLKHPNSVEMQLELSTDQKN